MRVGISGTHGTGKTTLAQALCAHLPGHVAADEPYYLLEAEGYEFGFPPSPEDYRALLARSVRSLSFLRRRQLGARLGGPSLPLDIGYSETIPAGIRNAVTLRDRHCQWAGGCNQPASACEVHHTKHKANGGKTSVKDCVLLCSFHHQVVIHRWGWTLVLNPDGTTTAWNKDRTKTLHSHGPPVRPG
jgi:5-methylcytosine-specific restriction endonuclease McrA